MKVDYGQLWNDKESLRYDQNKLKYDNENMRKDNENLRKDTENLRNGTENMRKDLENLTENHENLRKDYENLRNDTENLRKYTEKLSEDNENLRKDYENLKTSRQESIFERDELKHQLNTMEGRLQYQEAISLQITPRTCQTLADLGVTRTGEYFVDPDGVLIGDTPIKVLCDMQTDPVSTIVLHDSMGNTAIDRCAHPGCYNHSIKYGATMKQMVALIKQSKSCKQQIRYDCLATALTTGDIHYAWWVDRHGKPQYYWDGSNAGQHICKCRHSGNCTLSNLPCNCDARAPRWESDSGAITNETALPVTELRFGGLPFEGQKANYTLGGLTCKGKAPPPGNPAESCSTLRRAGNTRPGYYLINPKKGRLDVVMCRMDLEETDPKFQVETSARIAGAGFLHGKISSPDNPAKSCSSLRQAGNANPGYYLINPKEGRLDVVMCRMDLEETNPKFQVETSARIAGAGFLHGKISSPDNPAKSCSSLRQAGNANPGYYLINPKEGRLDVVMCRMDLKETDPKFQVETSARILGEGVYFDVYYPNCGALGVQRYYVAQVNFPYDSIEQEGEVTRQEEEEDRRLGEVTNSLVPGDEADVGELGDNPTDSCGPRDIVGRTVGQGQGQEGYALRSRGPVPDLPRVMPSSRAPRVNQVPKEKRVRWADQAGPSDPEISEDQDSEGDSDPTILALQAMSQENEGDTVSPVEIKMAEECDKWTLIVEVPFIRYRTVVASFLAELQTFEGFLHDEIWPRFQQGPQSGSSKDPPRNDTKLLEDLLMLLNREVEQMKKGIKEVLSTLNRLQETVAVPDREKRRMNPSAPKCPTPFPEVAYSPGENEVDV
ncbi:unnamed protein product [Darwinula stevensoni]|uniref:Uncharacterized protein n=1 Tax=Darwinula stevensoni TaxID=69355 RepID=A0A7R9FQJ0_9CRUS|nr:unnamed protein product [Darwinula stevensoni]CAG0899890.1 unnamed protein product [Darwinula stevensoni]